MSYSHASDIKAATRTLTRLTRAAQRVASASFDDMISVWDAITGEIVAGPFSGHTDSVNCIAFSPGGQHIASASDDYTIRMWDATTRHIVADPFTGHTTLWHFRQTGGTLHRPRMITQFACGTRQVLGPLRQALHERARFEPVW
jgi:WD40 repeat protein